MSIERQDALWAGAAVDVSVPGFFNVPDPAGNQAQDNQGFAQFGPDAPAVSPDTSQKLAVGVFRMRLQNGVDPAACIVVATPRGTAAAATGVVSCQVENGDDFDKIVRLSSGADPQVFIDQDFDILVIRLQ